jgi:lipopolysaccharide export system protein LptC
VCTKLDIYIFIRKYAEKIAYDSEGKKKYEMTIKAVDEFYKVRNIFKPETSDQPDRETCALECNYL